MTLDETAPAAAALSQGLLSWLPAPVRVPRNAWATILVAWPTALLPSILLSALAAALFPTVPGPTFNSSGPTAFLLLAVFSPVVETLIMAGVLSLLLKFAGPANAIIGSAVGWGVAHSLAAPAWGLVIWWPFLVFSTLFVVWRDRSIWLALAVPAAVHMLQNVGPAMIVAARAGA